MKIVASFNETISSLEAAKFLAAAAVIRPVYKVISNKNNTKPVFNEVVELADLGNRNYAVHSYRVSKDSEFSFCIGYYTYQSDNIETLEVETVFDKDTGEWKYTGTLKCHTGRDNFKERMRPILDALGIDPSKLEVESIESTAGRSFGDYSGKLLPWWMTKSEFTIALVKGILDTATPEEQFDYAIELITEAVQIDAKCRFIRRPPPAWVKEIHEGLLEVLNDIDPKIKRAFNALYLWDRFSDLMNEQHKLAETAKEHLSSIEDIK